MKKMIAVLTVSAMCSALFAGCGATAESTVASSSSNATEVTSEAVSGESDATANADKLKFDLSVSMDHPWGQAAAHFTELLEEASNGELSTEIYPSGTSGTEADSLAGMVTGTTDMTMTGGQFVTYSPYASLLEAPYAFGSEEDVISMMDSEVGDKIRNAYEEQGFHTLWYQLRGPRELTSNTPISSPADMSGVKMRMSGNPLHNDMWVACGAVTSTMSLTDCFTALSQGVVETQENPLDMIYDYSLNEVQKYVNTTDHVYSAIMTVISADVYNAMTDSQKAAIDSVSEEMQTYVNDYYFEHKDDYRQLLEDAGMQFNDDVDREAFKAAMLPVVEKYMAEQGEDVLNCYKTISENSAK